MKIILAQHFECDFLGETITCGLYEAGHEIYEIPYVKHLHGEPDIGYDLPGNPGAGNTGVPGHLQLNPLPANEKSEEEVLETARDADFIIAHSTRRFALEALDKIIARLGKNPGNIVLCDGEDSDWIDRDLINRYRPLAFFKRELTAQYSLAAYSGAHGIPIWPLQFGAFTRSFPKPEGPDRDKRYDIFLSLGRTHPSRDMLLGTFLDAVGRDHICPPDRAWIATNGNSPMVQEHTYGHLLRNLLPWSDYMLAQSQSRITASIRGFGRDALHAWEAFLCGPLVLYCPPGIHMPWPFVDRLHCIHFNEDCRIVPRALRNFLANEGHREAIANQGQQHCLDHHSTIARSHYLISICSKLRAGEKVDPEEFGL